MPLFTNTRLLLLLPAAVIAAGGLALSLGILPAGGSSPAGAKQALPAAAHARPAKSQRKTHRAGATVHSAGTSRVRRPPAPASFPQALEHAFGTHRVVVVATFLPKAALDTITLREARAGARAASVGFLMVNAARERQIFHVHQLFRVTSNPTILVLVRPGRVVTRLDGFADAATVAQAAANASADQPAARR
jgi:hypothetical protein